MGDKIFWWESDGGSFKNVRDTINRLSISAKFGGATSPLAPYVPPGLPCLILKATRHFLIDDLVVGGCRVFHSNY